MTEWIWILIITSPLQDNGAIVLPNRFENHSQCMDMGNRIDKKNSFGRNSAGWRRWACLAIPAEEPDPDAWVCDYTGIVETCYRKEN